MTHWLTEDEQRAWRGLLRVGAELDAEVNRQLQVDGLSKADYDVLVPLSEAPGGSLRPYEVAQVLAWEQSRLSHHLARMQARGLVQRRECTTDRRGAHVVLTDAGRAAIERAAPGHAEAVRALVFDGLTAEQVRALTEISELVLGRLSRSRAAADEAG